MAVDDFAPGVEAGTEVQEHCGCWAALARFSLRRIKAAAAYLDGDRGTGLAFHENEREVRHLTPAGGYTSDGDGTRRLTGCETDVSTFKPAHLLPWQRLTALYAVSRPSARSAHMLSCAGSAAAPGCRHYRGHFQAFVLDGSLIRDATLP